MKSLMHRKHGGIRVAAIGLVAIFALHLTNLHAQSRQPHWPTTAHGLSGVQGTELRYQVKIPSATGRSNLRATLFPTEGPEVYVKFGAPPTKSDYDCRSHLSDVVNSCRIDQLKSGTYHVMVLGNGPFSNMALNVAWDSAFAD